MGKEEGRGVYSPPAESSPEATTTEGTEMHGRNVGMVPIKFDYFDSPDQEKIVRDLLMPLSRLFPGWLLHFSVLGCATNSEDGECPCDIQVVYEYRRAFLRIYPEFFRHSEEEARFVLIHELVHILDGGRRGLVKDMLGFLRENHGPVAEIFCEQYEKHNEAATEDTAALLLKILDSSTGEIL